YYEDFYKQILDILTVLGKEDIVCEKVPASVLEEKFHVTVRTIQRDMVCITEEGIPVYSNHGKNGGYSILPSYKMKNCDIRRDEQQMIRQALEIRLR
ncbi:MAG: HTH domain-containing protein, partial [Eubacteriales bacterium]|nr:HTH domain-containing protein [Eubacteriales bacterium]